MFRCDICSFDCPTQLGLNNHQKMHRRKDAEETVPKRNIPRPKKRPRNNRQRPQSPGVNPSGDEGAIDDPSISLAAPVIPNTLPPTPPAEREDRSLLAHILSELNSLSVDDPSEDNFLSFCILVEQAVQEAQRHLFERDDEARPAHPRERVNKPDPDPKDPAFIQRLYTRNPKRTVRMITGSDGARCNLETETLFDFFSGAWGPASSDPAFYEETQETRAGVLDREFSVAEVIKKLRNAENSAAGPDRLTYHHWRTVDPSGKTLVKIFNLCLLFRRIPPSWKETKTILIPKKNVDLALPANWRPIALSNTIYKLFTKCITGRLTSWCDRYHAISPNQKGFMPHDGVLEHNFTLQERFNDARDNKSDSVRPGWMCLMPLVPYRIAPFRMPSRQLGSGMPFALWLQTCIQVVRRGFCPMTRAPTLFLF
ncbi:hypothetical protein AVEN_53805-1 [Araneus ventricosus]|uniref:C2H2-type domain-containing protein n=1 Tax=Araneus ventricosus TaxID=182803 RepID=A0A4Y2VHX2_ARAVE|nr:hypothetical protein AVEN_53805-1 [Araneus ventricosus]